MKREKDLLDVLGREEALGGKHHDKYILLGFLLFLVLMELTQYLLDIYIHAQVNTDAEMNRDKIEQIE